MVSSFVTLVGLMLKISLGMFLWVRLVIEELRNCFSDWDLEDRANSLPRGLKAAYVKT